MGRTTSAPLSTRMMAGTWSGAFSEMAVVGQAEKKQ
jgi:hypothetical protein